MNTDLTKIKKDIVWLINQVKCFMSVFPAATTWSTNHSATTGNKYLKDTLVWDDGFIYKCLVDNNSNPTSNSFYWEKVTKGWLLQQEQADWNATGGPSFIRNKPTSLGGGGGTETDPVFTAWLDTDPLDPYYLASNPAGYITSSSLTPYLTISSASTTYFPIPTGTISQYIRGDGSLATFPTIPTYTVNNGLSPESGNLNNFQLGGTLIKNTEINTGAFTTLFVGSASTIFTATNLGSGGAIKGNTTNGVAILGVASSGVGLQGNSVSDAGVQGFSSTGFGGQFSIAPATTNTADTVININRFSTGSPLNGIGASIDFTIQTNPYLSGGASSRLITKWSDVADATRTAQFEIWLRNNTILQRKISVSGNGQLTLHNYGTVTPFTGTPTYALGVDASGNVITFTSISGGLPTGGSAGQILTKVDATDYNATWQDNYADWTSVVKHTVKNNGASGTITKGTAVYVTGADGTNMLVGRASNASEATSSKTMGLMQSNITTTGGTQTGFVVTEGLLGGLDTQGTTAGDPVWLGVNGALIYGLINKPYAPAHLVFIGIVTKVSAGNGEIFVKVQNGFELKEIHDVDLKSNLPTNNQVLTYESATDLWKNKNLIDIVEDFNRTKGVYFFDDFMGNLSANFTNTTNGINNNVGNGQGTTRSTSTINNRTNQQGVVESLTSANATGTAGYYYSGGVYKGSGVITIETSLNFTTLSVLGERFLSLFGFYTGVNYNNPANCIVITYDEGGTFVFENPSTFFKCVTRSASGTRTTTITSIPVVAGQWYKLRINISADGGTVTFFIDNTLVGTHSTNIPLNSVFLPVGSLLNKQSGVAARAMQTDYFMYKEIFTNPR
jgi:hypothetical protein